jgi:hypothetical protein
MRTPQGEGEAFATFLKNLRLDLPNTRWQNRKRPSLFLLPGGEGQDEGEPKN